MRLATTLLLATLALPAEAVAETTLDVAPPREHAYWIGDRLTHRIFLTLPEGHALDRSTLPRPRSVTYWLDLREVAVASVERAGGRALEITTLYQTFYAPLEPKRLEVPAYLLRVNGPEGARDLEVPAWSFFTSPIRPILAPTTPDQLLPDDGYVGIVAQREEIATAVSALLALFGAIGLTWHQAWPPFHRRSARPLAVAQRQVRRLARVSGEVPLRPMCLAVHRGLDGTFRRPLLGADLDVFLTGRPEFAPLREQLQRFFQLSAVLFFAATDARRQADPAIAVPETALPEIAGLADRLAAIERGRG
ncbi:nonribosomal peptide synthetase MxaA [Algihabitans albus]|uniref:nonribosomal peptide synthetase MxaA n=1 Tax=Algihabitans albus TaxID=2164067 RepID=UPI000E5C5B2C|nr:nonribosomal peptide synthetase MxaA [Algihabitans albus]